MKIGIAAVGAVFVLLGVVAAATMRSDSSPNRAETVASQATAETSPAAGPGAASSGPATQPAKAPATTASTKPSAAASKVADAKTAPLVTIPAQPTAQDLERVMAAITASMAPPAGTTGTTAPLTKEQVEAQLREQLRLLGITY
jgi:hypothetical protein